MYLETTDYFERRRRHHGIDIEHVREALANEVHREEQPEARMRVWGYVNDLRKYVCVVLLPDGFTVLSAFADRSFRPPTSR